MKLAPVLLALLLGGASAALAQTWQTDPAFGARRDAYGPGAHMDATGRLYHDAVPGQGQVLELAPVQPNAYGPGVGMDAFGRPVVPSYQQPVGGGLEETRPAVRPAAARLRCACLSRGASYGAAAGAAPQTPSGRAAAGPAAAPRRS
jgi:hypothetical protein